MNNYNKQYGIVILLDVLGTRERIINDLDSYITDWELVINKLQINMQKLNLLLFFANYNNCVNQEHLKFH